LARKVRQRQTAPQIQRLAQQRHPLRLHRVLQTSQANQPPELVDVHPVRVQVQQIATGAAQHPHRPGPIHGLQQPTDAAEIDLQRAPRLLRRLLPHPVYQTVDRHRPASFGRQHRQHQPLPRPTGIDHPAVHSDLDRAQQAHLHPRVPHTDHPRQASQVAGSAAAFDMPDHSS
jgi:hypothetical protein